MSPSAFAAVQDGLAPLLSELSAYPLLHLRMADIGVAAYSHYRDNIMGGNAGEPGPTASILAICRLGLADEELISFLKSKLDAPSGVYAKPELISAIVVAMVKLGKEELVREFDTEEPDWLLTWRSKVLSGEGKTDVGPNNCMSVEWSADEDIPPVMAPGLTRTRGHWASRDSSGFSSLGAPPELETFATAANDPLLAELPVKESIQARASLSQYR